MVGLDYKVACVPVYDTSFWNDDRSIRVGNNCYNYGCHRALHGFSRPGRGAGHDYPNPWSTEDLDKCVRFDGPVPVDPDNPSLPSCCHRIMIFRWKEASA